MRCNAGGARLLDSPPPPGARVDVRDKAACGRIFLLLLLIILHPAADADAAPAAVVILVESPRAAMSLS
jgi:hypothetical protein